MASPTVVTVNEANTTADATSHSWARTAGVNGQLSIRIIAFDGGSAVVFTPPSGYTQFFRQDDTTNYGVVGYYKQEDGTETSPEAWTTDDAEKAATIIYSISGAANPATQAPEAANTTAAASTTVDCPSISPTGGSKDYLFIAGVATDGEEADDDTWHNTSPTNYTPSPGRQKTSGTGGLPATNTSLATFERAATTATENPASTASAIDQSLAQAVFTIAVHPPGAAATSLLPVPPTMKRLIRR